MAALFWLILAQPVVLVLANTTDTYTNDTFLVVDEEYDDDHDYSLIPDEEDTETSTAGDYFEDLIIAQLDSVDQTYDPFPIILTFNKPVIINIFFNFLLFQRCRKTWTRLAKLLSQEFSKIGRLVVAMMKL